MLKVQSTFCKRLWIDRKHGNGGEKKVCLCVCVLAMTSKSDSVKGSREEKRDERPVDRRFVCLLNKKNASIQILCLNA